MTKNPPFERGDTAICVAHHYRSCAHGVKFKVRHCWLGRRGWVIEVDHPHYGLTLYLAKNFINERETSMLHLAFKLEEGDCYSRS